MIAVVDIPVPVPEAAYGPAVERMVGRLRDLEGVTAIYQVGSVSTPGISDIDMFAVFGNGVRCTWNPLAGLSADERYLFAHSPYAASETDFRALQSCTYFHNYRLLWKSSQHLSGGAVDSDSDEALQAQTALEYLLKFYINMTVERCYGIVKVRGLFLHIKALLYDLDFLGIGAGTLRDLLSEAIHWRTQWFSQQVASATLLAWHARFYRELHGFLGEALARTPLYIPSRASLRVARNIEVRRSGELGYVHAGVTLPAMFAGLGRKYFNIQHRFNRFIFSVPYETDNLPAAVRRRYELIVAVKNYNARHLPFFLLPASSLPIF